jgi:hypothetical protein
MGEEKGKKKKKGQESKGKEKKERKDEGKKRQSLLDYWKSLPAVLKALTALIAALLTGTTGLIVALAGAGLFGPQTPTPVPPTATEVVVHVTQPTDTPEPTNTTVPADTPEPTNTTVPADTPVPPTDTPVPADTPVPPTDTPLPPTPTPTPWAVVARCHVLLLSEGPHSQCSTLGWYRQGEQVAVLGTNPGGEWLKVKASNEEGEKVGWMSAEYLQVHAAGPIPLLQQDCSLRAIGFFADIWQCWHETIGCPTSSVYEGRMTEQAFEGGWMFRHEKLDPTVFIVYRLGAWEYGHSGFKEGDPDPKCHDGELVPVRGFGTVWRAQSTVQEYLGKALECERHYDGRIQQFENGFMLEKSSGDIFVLFETSKPWERTEP